MHGGATIDENLADLNELLCQLIKLREDVSRESGELLADWDQKSNVSEASPTALNLAEYLALRRHDLSALQVRLAAYGLSSLGRSEAKALVALDAIIATLRRLCGDADAAYPPAGHDARRRGGAERGMRNNLWKTAL